MTAREVFEQQDGEVTRAYYADINSRGFLGQLAVALFRAQKRSTAAKKYRRGSHRRDAYDVKNWSLSEVCRILCMDPMRFVWGWKRDEKTPGFEWCLYCDLPQGQVSFHSASRLEGPSYILEFDGEHKSRERILAFCDSVAGNPIEEFVVPVVVQERKEPENPWDRMRHQVGG